MRKKKQERFTAVKFALPWAPSTNAVWRGVKRPDGRVSVIRSCRYEEFLEAVRARMFKGEIPGIVDAPFYKVTLYCFPPSRRKYDADNRLKATLDALTRAGFWSDDSLVAHVEVVKGAVCKGGMLGVVVEALRDPPACWDAKEFETPGVLAVEQP